MTDPQHGYLDHDFAAFRTARLKRQGKPDPVDALDRALDEALAEGVAEQPDDCTPRDAQDDFERFRSRRLHKVRDPVQPPTDHDDLYFFGVDVRDVQQLRERRAQLECQPTTRRLPPPKPPRPAPRSA